MAIKPQYKSATLYTAGGDLSKEWYMQYRFLDPRTGKYERFKERFDINRINDYEKRLAYGKAAVKSINRQLEHGYNPFEEQELEKSTPAEFVYSAKPRVIISPPPTDVPVQTESILLCNEAVLVSVQKVVNQLSKGATKDAKTTYKTMQTRWAKYVNAKGFQNLTANEITVDHVKAFKEYLQHEIKNGRKTINATKSHLGQFWDELKEMNLVSSNPFRSVKGISKRAARRMANKPKDRYRPPTTSQLESIVQHLKDSDMRGFLRFLATIYYEWVRPEEITKLRIFNIDLKSATINFSSDITKSDKGATIQIVPPYMKILQELEISKYPQHYFLFSEDYLPGPYQLNAKYACSNFWRRHVKDKIGVDINPYSLKHKGNIDYVLNNKGDKYDAKWHQMQNRHASLAQTEQYMRDLGVYFVDTDQLNFAGFM